MEFIMKFFDLFLKVEYFALASISNNELRNLLSIRINVSNILILLRIFNTITSMVIIATLLASEEATTKRKKGSSTFLSMPRICLKLHQRLHCLFPDTLNFGSPRWARALQDPSENKRRRDRAL